jgi:hypothetical protein
MNQQHIFTSKQRVAILLALLAGLVVGWYVFYPAGVQASPSGQIAATCPAPGEAIPIDLEERCSHNLNDTAVVGGGGSGSLAAVEQAQLLMMMSSLPSYVYLPTVLK